MTIVTDHCNGLVRFEVLGRTADGELLRTIARKFVLEPAMGRVMTDDPRGLFRYLSAAVG